MDFVELYTSAEGRINRKTWWLGTIGLVVIMFVFGLVFGVVMAFTGLSNSSFGVGLSSLVILAVAFVPYRSLTLKRLHDRDRPETLFWVFIGPSILLSLLTMLGLAGSVGTQIVFGQEVEGFQYNALGNAVNLVSIGVGIWSLVELGFLRGRAGENAHGPDPLASA